MIRFELPYLGVFCAVLAVALIAFITLRGHRQRIYLANTKKLKNSKTFLAFKKNYKLRRALQLVLVVCALIAFAALIAKPYDATIVKQNSEASDVVVVIDASSSAEPYFKQTAAALDDFLAGSGGNNVGIVLISGTPRVVSAPTQDFATLRPFISDLSTMSSSQLLQKWSGQEGSAIGDSIIQATDLFGTGNPRQKVMILMSDGLNNRGHTIEDAATYPSIRNVNIIAVQIQGQIQGQAMQNLGDQTHGAFVALSKPSDVSGAFATAKKFSPSPHHAVIYHPKPSLFIALGVLFASGYIICEQWRRLLRRNHDEAMFRKLVTNNSPALTLSRRRRYLRWVLAVGLVGLSVNLLLIQLRPDSTNNSTSQTHIYVAVDNSLSMNVKDVNDSSRIDVATKKLSQALRNANLPNTNLVTFHSYPVIYPEATSNVVAAQLSTAQPIQYFATQGSSFASLFHGLSTDIAARKKLAPNDKYYLVVVSDGEQTVEIPQDLNTELGKLKPLLDGFSIFGTGTEKGGMVSFNNYDNRYLSSGVPTITPTTNISSLGIQSLKEVAAFNETDYKTLNNATKPSDLLPQLPSDSLRSSVSVYYFYWPFAIVCFATLLSYLVLPYLNQKKDIHEKH
jgi:Mg-chelatase subunit ChlD